MRPEAQRQGVLAPIIHDTWWDGKAGLRADVRDVFAILVAVDPDHDASNRIGGGGELNAERDVEVRVKV